MAVSKVTACWVQLFVMLAASCSHFKDAGVSHTLSNAHNVRIVTNLKQQKMAIMQQLHSHGSSSSHAGKT